MAKPKLKFTEPEIQALFGHEAAEDEDPERLHDYYFKTSTYDQVATDLALRILVGHKGIGKSALFQVAISEDRKANKIAILVQPDDIADLGTDPSDFLRTVRSWKLGLVEIIAGKVLSHFGESNDDIKGKLKGHSGRVLDFLKTTFKANQRDSISLTGVNQLLIKNFLKDGVITIVMALVLPGCAVPQRPAVIYDLESDKVQVQAYVNRFRPEANTPMEEVFREAAEACAIHERKPVGPLGSRKVCLDQYCYRFNQIHLFAYK